MSDQMIGGVELKPPHKATSWRTEVSQFLTDAMTAAGMVRHGKQDRKFAERLADGCARVRSAWLTEPPVEKYVELKRLAEEFPADLDWDSNTEPFFNGPSGESLGGGATGFYCVYGKPFRLEGDDYEYDGQTYVESCNASFAKFMVAAREGVLGLIIENEALLKEVARLKEDNLALLENPGDAL